jgi:GNAT superfamily N-acetyltransferase
MSLPQLRDLHEDDAPTIRAWLEAYLSEHLNWWQQAYGALPERPLVDLIERDWKELWEARTSTTSFVQVLGETVPLGIVFAETRQDRYMGFEIGVLSWIYLDPASRGEGTSGTLMRAVDAWMTARGVRGREVFVTANNVAAVKLYERFGYSAFDFRMLAHKAPGR